jgi:hypothetical protein
MRLPADLPAGDYRLWVLWYRWQSDGTTVRLPVTGAETREDTIGVLPTHITIQPRE